MIEINKRSPANIEEKMEDAGTNLGLRGGELAATRTREDMGPIEEMEQSRHTSHLLSELPLFIFFVQFSHLVRKINLLTELN
jgi:hypothetical protein